ncbi:CU044_5270 family protein [Actinoallomurus sp. CA-142502]|uniref:CU044_5270 family protein n=1 Tax=Actinoallomurus sp. CA-142502 TaxID=3239885 RepID=UPI003D8F6093
MDELTAVQQLRAEVPLPTDLSTTEARFQAGLSDQRKAPSRARVSRRFGPARRSMVAGGLVAATLAAGVVTMGVFSRDRGDLPGGGGRTHNVAAVSALLDRAAATARNRPAPTPGQYVFTHTVNWGPTYDDKNDRWNGYRKVERLSWQPAAGGRPGFTRTKQTGTGQLPPADGTPVPGQPGWVQEWDCDRATRADEPVDLARPPANCTTSPAYASDLPTDADHMLAYLRKTRGEGSEADATWGRATDLLNGGLMPPKARAALFQAMKKIGGLALVADSVNVQGRHGVAVSHVVEGRIREELIFDPKTYDYLGARSVLVARLGDRPAGTQTAAETVIDSAFVNRIGDLPRH